MIGYILTETEKDLLQGKHLSSYQCFSCVQDINGVWFTFLSVQQMPEVEASQYAWLFDLPQAEYTPPPAPPFPI